MLPVLLVPTGRGVIKDGCTIFMPSKNDYLKYVYYHENRCKLSTSSTRQGDKRLGEWRGVNMNISVKKNILRKNILRDDEGKNVLHASIVAVESSSNFPSSSRIHCNNSDGNNLDTHNNNKNNDNKLNSRKDNDNESNYENDNSDVDDKDDNNENKNDGDDCDNKRTVLGYVTSGRYHGSPDRKSTRLNSSHRR